MLSRQRAYERATNYRNPQASADAAGAGRCGGDLPRMGGLRRGQQGVSKGIGEGGDGAGGDIAPLEHSPEHQRIPPRLPLLCEGEVICSNVGGHRGLGLK